MGTDVSVPDDGRLILGETSGFARIGHDQTTQEPRGLSVEAPGSLVLLGLASLDVPGRVKIPQSRAVGALADTEGLADVLLSDRPVFGFRSKVSRDPEGRRANAVISDRGVPDLRETVSSHAAPARKSVSADVGMIRRAPTLIE